MPDAQLIKGPPRDPAEFLKRLNNVLWGGIHEDLVDAVAADILDGVFGLIPIAGDAPGLVRTADILRQTNGDMKRTLAMIQGLDTIVGAVPVVGDIADILLPSNSVVHLIRSGVLPSAEKVLSPLEKLPLPFPRPTGSGDGRSGLFPGLPPLPPLPKFGRRG